MQISRLFPRRIAQAESTGEPKQGGASKGSNELTPTSACPAAAVPAALVARAAAGGPCPRGTMPHFSAASLASWSKSANFAASSCACSFWRSVADEEGRVLADIGAAPAAG